MMYSDLDGAWLSMKAFAGKTAPFISVLLFIDLMGRNCGGMMLDFDVVEILGRSQRIYNLASLRTCKSIGICGMWAFCLPFLPLSCGCKINARLLSGFQSPEPQFPSFELSITK